MTGMTLWVFFEEPFWVGVFERVDGDGLTAARVVFGAQPSDREVLSFVLDRWATLRFSPVVQSAGEARLASNPKRRQREAARAVAQQPGTRSQQALSLARETGKQERAARSRAQREEEQTRRRQLLAEKRKARHRGH